MFRKSTATAALLLMIGLGTPGLGVAATNRVETGSQGISKTTSGPQVPTIQALTSRGFSEAEGKGLAPSTPCGATDFESVC